MKRPKITMLALAIALILLVGCHTSDQEIRADIADKAQEDLNFSGLYYTVKNGVVDFHGRCPSKKALAKVRQTIASIHVIKSVRYNVHIGSVVLDGLTAVKLFADSILAKYPQVTARVVKDSIVLKGEATAMERAGILKELKPVRFKFLTDSITLINSK